MTETFDSYVATQLAAQLKQRHIVVWYDPRQEFASFVDSIADGSDSAQPVSVDVAGTPASLVTASASLYAARFVVEPLISADSPEALVLYLPGMKRDHQGSVLMELEKAGTPWEPQLRHLARNALRKKFTDGVIDDLLSKESTTYADISAALDGEGQQPPSALKKTLGSGTGERQIAAWLANPSLDAEIHASEATNELGKLVTARLGLTLEGDDLGRWRRIVARNTLAIEFRSDLAGAIPAELASVPDVGADHERNARTLCQDLRHHYRDQYPDLADKAAQELHLTGDLIDPLTLGSIDTFRFEERSLLQRCGRLVSEGNYAQVVEIHAQREDSFWLAYDVERRAQWEAIRLAAELGAAADKVDSDLARPPKAVSDWVDQYASNWHVLDRAQRHLEAWIPKLDDDPDELAINAVRNRYDSTLDRLATQFTTALAAANWDTGTVLHQTGVFDLVKPNQGRVAYFLVDAMRYEMGAELATKLQQHADVTIRPAVSVLPSITVTGMAALMPGASASYDVVEQGGKLQARVDGTLMAKLQARKRHMSARQPASADMELGEVLTTSRKNLNKKIGEANLVVVRSQDIDLFGEGGSSTARTVMNTVIDQLAQAVRKLADVGIGRALITSDHGHIYASREREEAMRIDSPGGDLIEIHRRCWIGRGGATPTAAVRVAATSLGNDSDLDFQFPKSCGVFRAGGDLAFHHGGASLQEMVIPVITVRCGGTRTTETSLGAQVVVTGVPPAVTTRIFTVKMSFESLQAPSVRPMLMANGQQVGVVGMVVGDGVELNRADGTVTVPVGVEATIGFVLEDEQVGALRVIVVDPDSDAELYRSPDDIPVELGVA